VNWVDNGGKSPIHHSAEAGDLETTQLLITLGSDLNMTDNTGKTPAAYANDNNHYEIVDALLAAGGLNIHTIPGEKKKVKESVLVANEKAQNYIDKMRANLNELKSSN
jgi:ankyrin repeat protein